MAYYMTRLLLPNPAHRSGGFGIPAYWKHVLTTSIAANMLGERIGFTGKFRLFTRGLIHDIGFVVLAACLPSLLDAIAGKVRAGVPRQVAKRALLGGLTHADIGRQAVRPLGACRGRAPRDPLSSHAGPVTPPNG